MAIARLGPLSTEVHVKIRRGVLIVKSLDFPCMCAEFFGIDPALAEIEIIDAQRAIVINDLFDTLFKMIVTVAVVPTEITKGHPGFENILSMSMFTGSEV